APAVHRPARGPHPRPGRGPDRRAGPPCRAARVRGRVPPALRAPVPRVKRPAIPDGGFRRIAVLRLSSLGDVVLTLPVVHALARAWPHAELHYWVKEEYAAVVGFDPAGRHVRALEPDARRLEDLVSMSAELEDCDLIVDLHGSLRSRVLTFRQRATVLRLHGRRWQRERWVRARWTRPAALPHATARYAHVVAPLGVRAEGPPQVARSAAARDWARARVAD